MERLTDKIGNTNCVKGCGPNCKYGFEHCRKENWENCETISDVIDKLAEYEDLEEQGRLVKLPVKNDTTGYRECVHTKSQCHHENYKCSECPLTELFCDEFYKAIDRCHEEAYASGCLAGMELGKSEAEAKLKELRGNQNGKV